MHSKIHTYENEGEIRREVSGYTESTVRQENLYSKCYPQTPGPDRPV